MSDVVYNVLRITPMMIELKKLLIHGSLIRPVVRTIELMMS